MKPTPLMRKSMWSVGDTAFEVVDDGQGVPAGVANRGRGGISMRRRAERLGSQLKVESGGQGTRVVLAFPVVARATLSC
jgi:signal transduction histidine kinase